MNKEIKRDPSSGVPNKLPGVEGNNIARSITMASPAGESTVNEDTSASHAAALAAQQSMAQAIEDVRGAPSATAGAPALQPLSSEQRHYLIEQAAYFRAESRGFAPHHAVQDWLLAQAGVDQVFKGSRYAS